MKTVSRFRILRLTCVCALMVLSGQLPALALAQEAISTPATDEVSSPLPPSVPVADSTPPMIVQVPDLIFPAADASGAVVTWPVPAATDETDGAVPVVCDWGSGSLFPLGSTRVTCSASDVAGNVATMTFLATVLDQAPPVIDLAPGIVVDAPDAGGAVVSFAPPVATDNVDGILPVSCDWPSGALFPVGASLVNCTATDAAGNMSLPVSFSVVVNPPPAPVTPLPSVTPDPTGVPVSPEPTAIATETGEALPTAEPAGSVGTATPVTTPVGTPASTPPVAPTPTMTPAATAPVTPTPTASAPVERVVPPMLDLPWPLPGSFAIDVYGGPLNGLQAIWGNGDYPITQEFGHTEFSIAHFAWYSYGLSYGLDGFEHAGIDIGMPAGTWLYSPVNGRVVISGDSPYYTYYGNGAPNVGELLIITDSGDEVVLGHMGRIAVNVGDEVTVGEFVGLSGGDNGDHLHLEVRVMQPGGWLLAVDPRSSFLIDSLAAARPEIEEAAAQAPLPLSPDTVIPDHRTP